MSNTILTVGFELAGNSSKFVQFTSQISLLDGDIILFRPDIRNMYVESAIFPQKYKGKPSLDDEESFALVGACDHWRREIKEAFKSGKTIIVFLVKPQEIFINTGDLDYSGTGRNQKVTTIVDLYSGYKALPIIPNWTVTQGSSMRLAPNNVEVLGSYWEEFGKISTYQVVFPDDCPDACIYTKDGKKPVSRLVRDKDSNGVLLLLPDINFKNKNFYQERNNKTCFSNEGKKFASKMISAVVSLNEALRSNFQITPPPDWSNVDCYALATELGLRDKLLVAEEAVESARKKKEEIVSDLAGMGYLRALLYEKGKPLENAILGALRIIGFSSAEQFQNHESEFDAVFESSEGRFIGEAEGKDNKAVNIDKLRQLEMNIQEDFQREGVDALAKGILFGNGCRFQEPEKRGVQFTPKCISAAKSRSTGLLPTTELFTVAKYLSDNSDDAFAKQCRLALINGSGIIKLPSPPIVKKTTK